MQKLRLLLMILAAVSVMSLLSPTAQAAHKAAPQRYSDKIELLSSESCKLPVAKRKGNWTCTTSMTRAVSPMATYCNSTTNSCWEHFSAYKIEFRGTGSYGYNSTGLGTVQLQWRTTLNGNQSVTSNFRFRSTRGISGLFLLGDRQYYSSAHPEGMTVNNGSEMEYQQWGSRSANTWTQWSRTMNGYANSYVGYENTVTWGGVYTQASWGDPSSSYPGVWFWVARTEKMLKNRTMDRYEFQAGNFGTQREVGGYDRFSDL